MDFQNFIFIKDKFLAHLAANQLAYNTQRSYKLDLEQLTLIWRQANKPEDNAINLEHALEIYQNILLKSNLTNSSLARKVSCLNSFKRFLQKQSININIKLKRPLVNLKAPDSLEEQTLSFVKQNFDHTELPSAYPLRDKAILELLFCTGIKSAELVSLELQHIDFKNSSITIINSNPSKNRTIDLSETAILRLKDYISKERPESKSECEKIFLNCKLTPLSVRSIQHICVMFRKYFNQEKLTPNLLRNSYAVKLFNDNTPVEEVQEKLGHKTRISTERYKNKL